MIYEAFGDNRRAGRHFGKEFVDLDQLPGDLAEDGFEFETVADMLEAIQECVSGNPVLPSRTLQQVDFSNPDFTKKAHQN